MPIFIMFPHFAGILSSTFPCTLIAIIIISPFLYVLYASYPHDVVPLVNGKRLLDVRHLKAQKRFVLDAHSLIKAGLEKYSVFKIVSDNGLKFILSPKYANEIRNSEALSLGPAATREFHSGVHGFEPFKQVSGSQRIVQDAIRVRLTQNMGKIIGPISEETSLSLQQNWTDYTEWHRISLKSSVLKVIARVSSRVFLGEQICRNPRWLCITVGYTVDAFLAAENLRPWPRFMHSVVALFFSSCRKIRAELQEAREILDPLLAKRKNAEKLASLEGDKTARYNDCIEWLEECANGRPYDPVAAQLSFSFLAIHTTSDMITQALYDICGHEGLIQDLREEALSAIQEDGWGKSALHKMVLMDSTLKESQRLKPSNITSMRRWAEKSITLSDGTHIPKDTYLLVSNIWMWDPLIHPNPEQFDARRFLKLREVPGKGTSAHLASPSPEHMGFGLGKHVCPGRFFAANMIKIVLCHMLLKYDIRIPPRCAPQIRRHGLSMTADPSAEIEVRRRKVEVEL